MRSTKVCHLRRLKIYLNHCPELVDHYIPPAKSSSSPRACFSSSLSCVPGRNVKARPLFSRRKTSSAFSSTISIARLFFVRSGVLRRRFRVDRSSKDSRSWMRRSLMELIKLWFSMYVLGAARLSITGKSISDIDCLLAEYSLRTHVIKLLFFRDASSFS
jgi:hypothetical protein